ncbi:MAG: saccharopine dehydrogenase NADP-binding domain-containing protein [Microthrixaceae bacterium]
MRLMVIGAGGVGAAFARIVRRRDFFERLVLADLDLAVARRAADAADDPRVTAIALDASSSDDVAAAIEAGGITAVLNLVDPRFVRPIFESCLAVGVTYVDLAMSMSRPHPTEPFVRTGLKLGEKQFLLSASWERRGALALVGMGNSPGLTDVFARYAADHLFDEVHEVGVRRGGDLVVHGHEFAPTSSMWSMVEQCLNPPVIWERGRGWYTTEPFSGPEFFTFPEGIGPRRCVNAEHEEVMLIPRWVDCRRVTFKHGISEELLDVLATVRKLGLDSVEPVEVRGGVVAPRDVLTASLPDPATLTGNIEGHTCVGTWVSGVGHHGEDKEVFLYHVAENAATVGRDGVQAVLWQAALFASVALELLASGVWSGSGVRGAESFDPVPFLDLVKDGHDAAWGMELRRGDAA